MGIEDQLKKSEGYQLCSRPLTMAVQGVTITPFSYSRHPLVSVNPFRENRTDDNKSGMDEQASWSSRRRV